MNYHRQLNIMPNTNGQIKDQNQMQCLVKFSLFLWRTINV